MKAALAGIAAAIVIAVIAGAVLSTVNPSTENRFAVESTTRL